MIKYHFIFNGREGVYGCDNLNELKHYLKYFFLGPYFTKRDMRKLKIISKRDENETL